MCILTLTKMSTLVSPIRYLPSETLIMGNCVGQVHLATKSRTCNKSCSKRVSQCICVRLKKDWFSPLQGHETTRYFIRNENRARLSSPASLSRAGLSLYLNKSVCAGTRELILSRRSSFLSVFSSYSVLILRLPQIKLRSIMRLICGGRPSVAQCVNDAAKRN